MSGTSNIAKISMPLKCYMHIPITRKILSIVNESLENCHRGFESNTVTAQSIYSFHLVVLYETDPFAYS